MIAPPIGVLVPYLRFKSCHLNHHINENITDPYDDPESYYLDREVWAQRPAGSSDCSLPTTPLPAGSRIGPALGHRRFRDQRVTGAPWPASRLPSGSGCAISWQ
jgi:hypothetical protein